MKSPQLLAVTLFGCSAACSPAFAPPVLAQTISLHVTGSVQSADTSRRNFGKLPKQYRAADWTVTNNSPQAIKIPLARILQLIKAAPGVSILSPTSSTSVVQDAQGSNPLSSISRVGTGVVGGFATCEGLKICPSGGSWSQVVLGAEILTLVMQYVLPTLPSHALQSIPAMLPAVLNIDALDSLPGMIIVELAAKVVPADLDVTLVLPYPAAPGVAALSAAAPAVALATDLSTLSATEAKPAPAQAAPKQAAAPK